MSRVPFLKWYPSDYLGDTMHLTTLEHGAYTLLLWHYWLSGPLPDDDRVLARIAKVSPTIFSRKFSSTIRTFFVKESDGKLHQKRMDKDREKLEEKIEKTRAAASKSWENRSHATRPAAANATENADANASADDPLRARGLPDTRLQKKKESKTPPRTPPPAAEPDLPDWVPTEAWAAYVEMRRKIPRKPFTLYAQHRVIERLDRIRAMGHDTAAVLNESTINGWAGVFVPDNVRPRAQAAPGPTRPTGSRAQRFRDSPDELVREDER